MAQGSTAEQHAQASWIGDGLPAIPKRLLEKLQRWEFAELGELRPLRANEVLNPEPDPQRFIILPGLEAEGRRRNR